MADSGNGVAVRRVAAEAVAAVLGGSSLSEVLPPAVQPLDSRDRAFVQELVYGTIRWWFRLSWVLDRLMKRRPSDPYIPALLACGIYQLWYMRVPPHAAVSTTVAAAPKGLRPLCNGVLRNSGRRRGELEAAADKDAQAAHAHPHWLLSALREDWPDDWMAIVAANNAQAPMTLRVRGDRAAYIEELAAAGMASGEGAHAPHAVVLRSAVGVDKLPGFAEGRVSVQDEAAQLAAPLVDPQPGMRVLDACAAPGGKTAHLLDIQPEMAELVAVDDDAARMTRVAANLERTGQQARLVVADATAPDTWWDGAPFDRILLDAPCSATGVIRRHPDIRILRRAADIGPLAERQSAMLDALWRTLAPGGLLVYATCSVLRAENAAVVTGFVERTGDARLHPITAGWGRDSGAGRQVLPGQDGMDGFHYACLLKEGG